MEKKIPSNRKYRFFYHYFKQKKKMSVHFKGQCHVVNDIQCNVPCETKWNTTQPNLIMRGFAKELIIENGIAVIK